MLTGPGVGARVSVLMRLSLESSRSSAAGRMKFRLESAAHQLLERRARILVIEEHLVHLLRDRHLHPGPPRQLHRGAGRGYALGHHPEVDQYSFELSSAGEGNSELVVAGEAAPARGDQ